MHKTILGLTLVVAVMLCGCSEIIGSASVDELLRAPQSTQQMHDIQSALNTYKGETVQLKYPRGYKEQSPILLADIDADNVNEAVILYVSEQTGQSVQLAVLENSEDGWQVVQDIEGLSTEVMDLELAQIDSEETQIIVGYANATLVDKFLCVYIYKNNSISFLLETAYTNYLVEDLDGDDVNDLTVVSNGEEEGALAAQWLALNSDKTGMELMQTISFDTRFVTSSNLIFAQSGQNKGLIVEGTFENGWVANEVFKYINESANFITWPQNETDVPLTTLRYVQNLNVSILDETEILRVPTNVTKISTFTDPDRFYYVTWQDYLAHEQSLSLFNSYSIYAGSAGVANLQKNPTQQGEELGQDVRGTQSDEETGVAQTTQSGIRRENEEPDGPNKLENIQSGYGAAETETENVVHPLGNATGILPNIPSPSEPYFGIYDSQYSYFVRIPQQWAGSISVTKSNDNNAWQINDISSGKVLLSVVASTQELSENSVVYIGSKEDKHIYIITSAELPQSEKDIIKEGAKMFDGEYD